MKKLLFVVLASMLMSGCRGPKVIEKPVYISADRHQYMMTNEVGVVGWFVPVAVHAEMMEALILMEQTRNENRK